MNYEIIRYRPELRAGVVALLHHLVSSNPELNDAYFRWKHETNPYAREPVVYVALSQGEVVGMRAFQGAHWQLGAEVPTQDWPCACDFVVTPEHRGNKLFRQIMEFAIADLARRGIDRMLNWSASPVTYGASLRSGWRLVGTYDSRVRLTARTRQVRRLSERIRQLPLVWRLADVPAALCLRPGFGALDAGWARKAVNATLTLEKRPRAEAMADLVRRTARPRFGHVRDATYYRWRFDNPLSEYRFLFATEEQLQGYLVLRVARLGDLAEVSVVDWAADSPARFESLLAHVVESDGYDHLSLWSAALAAETRTRIGEWGLGPDDRAQRLPEYRPGLLVLDTRGAERGHAGPVACAPFATSFDEWELRPLYSDFY